MSAAWRDQWTGVFVLEREGLPTTDRVEIRNGGLVSAARSRRLARIMAVGRVRFEAGPVVGQGDRRMLGRVLTAVSRAVSGRLSGTLPSDAVVELAMPPERLASCVSPDLVDRLLGRPAVVGALVRDGSATIVELRALAWLGVVRLHRGRKPLARRSMRQPGPRPGGLLAQLPGSGVAGGEAREVGGPGEAPLPVLGAWDIADDPTPQVDDRPIPMPELEGIGEGQPIVHLGMRQAPFHLQEAHRIDGVAFGEDQRPDMLPAELLSGSEAEASLIPDDALLSGVEDELADVLSDDEVALLLGLPGARARARPTQAPEPPVEVRPSPSQPKPRSEGPVPEARKDPPAQAPPGPSGGLYELGRPRKVPPVRIAPEPEPPRPRRRASASGFQVPLGADTGTYALGGLKEQVLRSATQDREAEAVALAPRGRQRR